jgi:hypothetical protein
MKLSCVDQSASDGDCYLLKTANRVILYGNLLRQSSLLRYLPAYFEFNDDSIQKEESPKNLKRQKQANKLAQFN